MFILAIDIPQTYICIDAQQSSANAIKKQLPNSDIIMCYFHLMQNVRKHLHKLVNKRNHEVVKKQIGKLHFSKTKEIYEKRLDDLYSKWGQHGMKKFREYFWKQWIKSDFNKWQIFRTPAGYSMTNSPIESYNNKINSIFQACLSKKRSTRLEEVERKMQENAMN